MKRLSSHKKQIKYLGKYFVMLILIVATLFWGVISPTIADMPYPGPPPGVDPYNYHLYLFLTLNSELPNDFSGGGNDWKLTSAQTTSWLRFSKQELQGVMGVSVDKAWQISTGRPDVIIAVLDSGIKWQDNQPDLFNKLYLNRGELPMPEGASDYDANYDGVFNILDYTDDPRVSDKNGNGVNDPEDVILIFSDGIDDDGNGYVDDISGWDFFEGDNNPRDDVRYGHGTGEAIWSSGEANNGGQLGPSANAMVLPVRVGDSFIADINEFAQGVVFAVDSGATIIQEALGTFNNTRFAQQAVDYAYRRGVTIVGSAGDEQSARHNFPANYPHIIMTNSVTKYMDFDLFHQMPPSYLYLNGCTNFGGRIDVAVSSASCSSEACGKLSGMVGLIYATARNEIDRGELQPYPGTDWPLSPNEVKQIVTMSADDINFETPIENYQTWFTLLPSERFHSRPGWDIYFGYGRANAHSMLKMVDEGRIPPEVEMTTPGWFDIIDPDDNILKIVGRVAALRATNFTYKVEVAPNVNPGKDYITVYESGILTGVYEGKLADIDLNWLSSLMPRGVEGPLSGDDGRGAPDRFSFTVRVKVTDNFGRRGEERRSLFLHRDRELMGGFPKKIAADGVSSPVFVDLNDDGSTELVYATTNGEIHALKPDGAELHGWPVTTDPIPLIEGSAGYKSGEISLPVFSPIMIGSPAIGDLEGDGNLEVVAADMEGKIYVWEPDGSRRGGFPVSTNRGYSTVFRPNGEYRRDKDNRVDWGIAAQPALSDLNGDGSLEIVAGAMDMHVYAWQADGTALPGWPVYLRSPEKVEFVEPGTHFTILKTDADARIGSKIISTPSIGDITGDGVPEVIIGTNEEYHEFPNIILRPETIDLLKQAFVSKRKLTGEDDFCQGCSGFIGAVNLAADESAVLDLPIGNGRLYAIWADGTLHDGDPGDDDGLDPDSFVSGWPVRVGQLILEVLPMVGTGMNMPAVLADVDGDGALEVGASSVVGPYYVFDGDGVSIYGRDLLGRDRALPHDKDSFGEKSNSSDGPTFAAMGGGIFADLSDGISVVVPTGGLTRLLDVELTAEQLNSDAQISAWHVDSNTFQPGFPHEVNDIQFLTQASVADVDGDGLPEILTGSSVYDVHAVDRNGEETSNWPKLAGDAVYTTPSVGDFDGDGTLEIAALSRGGLLLVWHTSASASGQHQWPKYQHDLHNSGNYNHK
ncbi:hypothetical protein FJZ31_15355 [Candidatus Poribacteria bacterium]|nr:hypothetical protein [Candidatus Poribacteria bacterium]